MMFKKCFSAYRRSPLGRFWLLSPVLAIGGLAITIFAVSEWNAAPYYVNGLSCDYTNITYHIGNKGKYYDNPVPTWFANIYGQTINSTLCTGNNLEYYEYYYDTLGLVNKTDFIKDIEKKFPIGQNISCSVTSDCTQFRPCCELPRGFDGYDFATILAVTVLLLGLGLGCFFSIHGYLFYRHNRERLLPISRS
jgi:hypothetical protein